MRYQLLGRFHLAGNKTILERFWSSLSLEAFFLFNATGCGLQSPRQTHIIVLIVQ